MSMYKTEEKKPKPKKDKAADKYFAVRLEKPGVEPLIGLEPPTDEQLRKGKCIVMILNYTGRNSLLKNWCFLMEKENADRLIKRGAARPYSELEYAICQLQGLPTGQPKLKGIPQLKSIMVEERKPKEG